MRLFLLTLLFPFYALGQAVPLEKGKIVYEDEITVMHTPKDQLFDRAKQSMDAIRKYANPSVTASDATKGKLEVYGKIRMTRHQKTNYAVAYHLSIQVKDNQYKYRIDSLTLLHFKRHKTTTKEPEDLLDDINNSDKVAVESEQQINEMDMNIIKLIDLLNNQMKKI